MFTQITGAVGGSATSALSLLLLVAGLVWFGKWGYSKLIKDWRPHLFAFVAFWFMAGITYVVLAGLLVTEPASAGIAVLAGLVFAGIVYQLLAIRYVRYAGRDEAQFDSGLPVMTEAQIATSIREDTHAMFGWLGVFVVLAAGVTAAAYIWYPLDKLAFFAANRWFVVVLAGLIVSLVLCTLVLRPLLDKFSAWHATRVIAKTTKTDIIAQARTIDEIFADFDPLHPTNDQLAKLMGSRKGEAITAWMRQHDVLLRVNPTSPRGILRRPRPSN